MRSRAEVAEAAALVVATGEVDGHAIATASWGSGSVLEHVVQTVREAGIARIVVVIGPSAEEVVDGADLGDATIVIDPEWDEGPAASLRCGLDELMRSDDSQAAVLLTVEQPQVAASVIAAVVAGREVAGATAAIPKYRYATGLPLVVHRDLWPRLMGLEGNARPEALFKAHPEWVHEMWVDRLAPVTVTTADELSAIAPRI
jgi:CTP:molybdopterin cytidylyltransferase MocA